ncbi:MAG TPA: VOC family protein [Tepidisphaeraceae bacterium]|jgi:catechol 2,3-dioxygenase-like lactoylglutathione lyase family enzyme|nr:VOC family protein [Tepidisphaeraceae bacterium]
MLRKIDRMLVRVPNLDAAVRYYRDTIGLSLLRHDARLANFKLADTDAELVLHSDPDLPDQAIYYLVDDVRDLYSRRADLRLTFINPPAQVSRGYSATVKDPFGNILMLLDRTGHPSSKTIEDAKPPGSTLFAGIEQRSPTNRDLLSKLYVKVARTADDLPYTPHFETLFTGYIKDLPDPKPTRAEVWRHLLNMRKAGKLPKLGEARSPAPEISPEHRQSLRDMLSTDIGRRDRLPYSPRFDQLVDQFNKTQPKPLSPHLVWRLVATLAK